MKIAPAFLIVMMIFVMEETNADFCYLEMVNGKLQKFGDCDNKQQSQVLKDLDNKLEKYKKKNHKSCKDVTKPFAKVINETGGVFDIYPESMGKKVEVYCDLETDGGGWTVFQRRMDGSEDFYRGWNDYVDGFGTKINEYWLGLENLHQMTKNGNYELRIELEAFDGSTAHAKYGSFSIGSSAENYTLNVSLHSGTAQDSLDENNGWPFTTKDKDNDGRSSVNCAEAYTGAWWYHSCSRSNLNGQYNDTGGSGWNGVFWFYWKRNKYLKSAEMKFRRVE